MALLQLLQAALGVALAAVGVGLQRLEASQGGVGAAALALGLLLRRPHLVFQTPLDAAQLALQLGHSQYANDIGMQCV